jgi:hypothetical protein
MTDISVFAPPRSEASAASVELGSLLASERSASDRVPPAAAREISSAWLGVTSSVAVLPST